MNPENLPTLNPDFLIPLAVLTFLLLLTNFGFHIYVSREVKKAGKDLKTSIGKYTWLRYFFLGWSQSKNLKIVDIMAFWTFLLTLTGISFFLFMLTLMQSLP